MARIIVSLGLLLFLLPSLSNAQETTEEQSSSAASEANKAPRVRRLGDSLAVDAESEWVPSFDTSASQADLERKLNVAERALANGDLLSPPNANALLFFQQVLETDETNERALAGLDQIAETVASDARVAFEAGNEATARNLMTQLRNIRPDYPELAALEREFSRQAEIDALLTQGDAARAAGRFDQPAGSNAIEAYRAVLAIDAGNTAAQTGIDASREGLLVLAGRAVEAGEFAGAEALISRARSAGAATDGVSRQLASAIGARLEARMAAIETQVANGEIDAAEQALEALLNDGYAADQRTAAVDVEIARVRRVRAFPAGSSFEDGLSGGENAPTMLVIPAGSFEMGSPRSDRDRSSNEGPQTEIRFNLPFALGVNEVTVGQFGTFVEATGYVTDAERNGESTIYNVLAGSLKKESGVSWRNSWQGQDANDDDPVVHVSWNDATAYAAWLAEETGERYRLPSESEFEYALKAGTTTPFWWGRNAPREEVENLTGEEDRLAGRWEWPDPFENYGDDHWGPAPVGSFVANPFGLFDIGGNVMEWVADCYVSTIEGIPADGSPRGGEASCQRILKGGSWATPPRVSRSAQRTSARDQQVTCLAGFRVARSL